MPGEVVAWQESRWILLHHDSPSGFYYTRLNRQITGFGISGEVSPSRPDALKPKQYVTSTPSPPSTMIFSGLFLSVASLSKIQRVDLCRCGSRCTGILITYTSGKSVALGQYTHDASHSRILLDGGPHGFSKICFTMSKSGRGNHRSYVKNVRFLEEDPSGVSEQEKLFNLDQVTLWKD